MRTGVNNGTLPAAFRRVACGACQLPLVLAVLLFRASPCGAAVFTNPVLPDGADPWAVHQDGSYYYTQTTGSDVQVRRSRHLTGPEGIASAPVIAVFRPPAPFNRNVWAPELHFLRGKAYLYYSADDGDNADHRMFAAESDVSGETLSVTFKGKLADPNADRWAIDGTVLEKEDGSLYFIWSGWPGTQDGRQNLYIAPMRDPVTLGGPRVLLSAPDRPWESWIEEGPAVLRRGKSVFIVYAANRSWTDEECMGMLSSSGGDPLSPSSWEKSETPVFASASSANGSVYGPGHCSLTVSPDGAQDWILYHAAKRSGSGWDRDIRLQPFYWSEDGRPDFGQPVPAGTPIVVPSGDAKAPASEAAGAFDAELKIF